MAKKGFIIFFFSLCACLPFRMTAHNATTQQETSLPAVAAPDLAGLQLASARQLELQDALNRRDFKQAETILVEEAERDPKSIRASKLLILAGSIFFLDGEYANSA